MHIHAVAFPRDLFQHDTHFDSLGRRLLRLTGISSRRSSPICGVKTGSRWSSSERVRAD
jgi:hypothetical protein